MGKTIMKENAVQEKSFEFALRIVRLYKYLTEDKREHVLSKQLLRSGTAIGALISGSQQAESKADFIHKLSIALKEANESEYWIKLLSHSEFIDDQSFSSIQKDNQELLKLLTAIIKTTKSK